MNRAREDCRLEKHSTDVNSLDKAKINNSDSQQNVCTDDRPFKSIGSSKAANKENIVPISLSNVKSNVRNVDFNGNDDSSLEQLFVAQLNCPILSAIEEACVEAKVPDQNLLRGIAHSSSTGTLQNEVSAIPCNKFKSSEERAIKPMLSERKTLPGDKDVPTFLNTAIGFHDNIDYDKDRVDHLPLTDFSDSDSDSDNALADFVASIPPIEPICKQNYKPEDKSKNDDVDREPRKKIRSNGGFTYKHTYFDDDGNAIEAKQTSSELLPVPSRSKGNCLTDKKQQKNNWRKWRMKKQ